MLSPVCMSIALHKCVSICVCSRVNMSPPPPPLIKLLSCCCNSLPCCESFTLERRTSHSPYLFPSIPRDPFNHFQHTLPLSLLLLLPFISLFPTHSLPSLPPLSLLLLFSFFLVEVTVSSVSSLWVHSEIH